MSSGGGLVVVVPCFNEAARLPAEAFVADAARRPQRRYLFVDDGSRDATLARLRELEGRLQGQASVLAMPQNVGKAEAVRAGVLAALELDPAPALIGFLDADLSTALEELDAFERLLERRPLVQLATGARVQMLGRRIERKTYRHYVGRVFATFASMAVGLPVYDTQCGAKVFRAEIARGLFEEPLIASWSFDVELIARYQLLAARELERPDAEAAIFEVPLSRWRDVAGSKVKPLDFVVALYHLLRIRSVYGRARRRARRS